MRFARLIGPDLELLLRESPAEVSDLLAEIHPEDIADVVDEWDDDRAAEVLQQMPTGVSAQVFERLSEERQERLTHRLGVESTAKLALEMDADERADFFSQLPPALGKPLLEKLEKVDPEAAEDVEELTRWPETSAGGLMTTDFVSVRPKLLVADAIEEVRRRANEAEILDALFVVEGEARLVGVLTLRDMLIAEPSERIEDVMRQAVISVPPELDQEEVARKLAKYDLHTLPVVSDKGDLLGVITSDDVLDVLTAEQTEDVHKLGAVEPLREGYFDTRTVEFIKKRAPWLLVLFFGGFLTTATMRRYDQILGAMTQLAFYVPMLVSAGGNSGSQSSTLVIRALAVGDVRARDWWRVLLRELMQGLLLGAILALVGAGYVLATAHSATLALLIAATLLGIVTTGCVIGAMMPLLLHRIGLDPATSSNPFIATLCDVIGIAVYLGLASIAFGEILAAAAQP
jgi:magnesium transporter